MTRLAIVDTETTGLDPHRHRIWEVVVILATHEDTKLVIEDAHRWWVELAPEARAAADPTALRINHFHARTSGLNAIDWTPPSEFARYFAYLTAERHLVGAVPSFDERRLDDLLRAHGQCPAWHYHLICVLNLAAGALAGREYVDRDHIEPEMAEIYRLGVPPWRSDDLAAGLDVEPPIEAERHTAMGDARWAMRTYATVYDLEIVE